MCMRAGSDGRANTRSCAVLALLCLVRYAEAASKFKDKRDFAEYLDFVYRAE